MEYRKLGRTGLKVSSICLGTMQFGWTAGREQAFAIMNRALELGCNFFDTADVYSRWAEGNPGGVSEEIIGSWLANHDHKRENLIIATKVRGAMSDDPNDQGLSRHHIMHSVEASLRRLRTDYIDLYQLHWPDEETPLEETITALDVLVRSGKVRYIGCSNFPAWLLTKSLWVSDRLGKARFDSLQPHYNLLHRAEFERELQPLCLDQGIGVIPYSPLGGGFLTGKYQRNQPLPESARGSSIEKRYMNERGFTAVEALAQISFKHQVTVAQTAIAWVLANPAVSSAIIGANSITQLEDTIHGANVNLDTAEKDQLDQLTSWKS